MLGIWIGLFIMLAGMCVTDASMLVPAIMVLTGASISGISWLRYQDAKRAKNKTHGKTSENEEGA